MVETIPRPKRLHPLLQITIAVLSGAAAMHVVQTFERAPSLALKPRIAPAPALREPPAAVAPAPEKKLPVAKESAAPVPAASSMLVKPEDSGGLKPTAILGAYDDETSHPKPAEPPKYQAPEREDEPKSAQLQQKTRWKAPDVGKGFQQIEFKPMVFKKPKKEAPSQAAAPQGPPPLTQPKVFERPPIAADAVPIVFPKLAERPKDDFWTLERRLRTGLAFAAAVGGFGFLLARSGLFGGGRRHDLTS